MLRRVHPIVVVGHGDVDTLVILFHGCTWTARGRRTQLHEVADAVQQMAPRADVFAPLLPIELWSLENPDAIVSAALDQIDRVWQRRAEAGRGYQRVVLIGFSFGSVLLRQLYCRAAGADEDGSVRSNAARPWAILVDRMVLLAGLNRGWTVDSPVSRVASLWNHIGTAIGHLLPRKPTLFAIRRGAPFLSRTRLQWLALGRASLTPPLTVQLLGTRDDIVSPVDNTDLAAGHDFVYLEVPRSGHCDVIHVSADDPEGRARRECFALAFMGSPTERAAKALTGGELLQLLPTGTHDEPDRRNA